MKYNMSEFSIKCNLLIPLAQLNAKSVHKVISSQDENQIYTLQFAQDSSFVCHSWSCHSDPVLSSYSLFFETVFIVHRSLADVRILFLK